MFLQKAVYILASWLLIIAPAFAGDVSLAWDPSVSDGVVGYKVYYGPSSRSYNSVNSIPNQTSYTVTGLDSGLYYFAVTALDSAGNESGYSNEVFTTVGDESGTPIFLSALVSKRFFGAVATCTTDRNTSAIIRYKPSDGDHDWIVNFVTVDPWRRNHTASMSIDTGGEDVYYKYQWEVTDSEGRTATMEGTFLVRTD